MEGVTRADAGPEEIARLEGHVAPVVALAWRENDASLYTGGGDGAVYAWGASAFARGGTASVPREAEYVAKGHGVGSVTAGAAGSLVVALGVPKPFASALASPVAAGDDDTRARKRYTPAPGGGGGAAGGRGRVGGMAGVGDAGAEGQPLTLLGWSTGLDGESVEVVPQSKASVVCAAPPASRVIILYAGTDVRAAACAGAEVGGFVGRDRARRCGRAGIHLKRFRSHCGRARRRWRCTRRPVAADTPPRARGPACGCHHLHGRVGRPLLPVHSIGGWMRAHGRRAGGNRGYGAPARGCVARAR